MTPHSFLQPFRWSMLFCVFTSSIVFISTSTPPVLAAEDLTTSSSRDALLTQQHMVEEQLKQLTIRLESIRAQLKALEQTPSLPQTEEVQQTRARLEQEEIQTLEQIVVTATRTKRTVSDLPISSTVVTQQEIEESPAILFDDMLRMVPTLNFDLLPSIMRHPGGSNPSIRGLGDQRVLFLLDNVPLNDPFFGYVDFNRVPKERIERVELVRGGSSSLWGGFAEGGVVNIITKPIDTSRTTLTTMGGSNSTVRTDLSTGYRINDQLGIGLDFNYFTTDGFITAETPLPFSRPTATTAANVQVKVSYQTDDFEGFIRGNYHESHQDLRTRLTKDFSKITNVATGGKWRLDHQNTIQSTIFYMNEIQSSQSSDPDPNAPGTEFVSNLHSTPSNDIGGYLQWTHANATRSWLPLMTVGVDLRHIEGSDRSQLIASDGTYDVRLLNSGGQQLFAGLFGEVSVKPVEAWEILPSVRLDYVRNYSASQQDSVPGAPIATTNFKDQDFVQVNPKLATRYQIIQPLAVRASVYRGFKHPTLDPLYRTFSATGFRITNNSQLSPEVLWGGEVGIDLTLERFRGQLNYFYNTIKDQITYIVVGFSPFTLQPTNVGRLRSQGIEFIGDLKLTETLSANLSYSYTDSKIVSNPNDPTIEGNRTPFVPIHYVSVVARYRHPSGARIELRGRYLSKMMGDTSNNPSIADAHIVVDASASYPFMKHLDGFIIAQNIFDERYVANTTPGNHLGAPFQIFGGMTVSFGGGS